MEKKNVITRAWRIYNLPGHRQRESFSPSRAFTDWRGNDIEIRNSDITGTNDYSIILVTSETAEACERVMEGQLSDGVFENCRSPIAVEVSVDDVPLKPFPVCALCGHEIRPLDDTMYCGQKLCGACHEQERERRRLERAAARVEKKGEHHNGR